MILLSSEEIINRINEIDDMDYEKRDYEEFWLPTEVFEYILQAQLKKFIEWGEEFKQTQEAGSIHTIPGDIVIPKACWAELRERK